MGVSLWAVLGVVCLVLGLPFVLLGPGSAYANAFAYVVGGGAAFLIVGIGQWLWDRWGSSPEPELADAGGE